MTINGVEYVEATPQDCDKGGWDHIGEFVELIVQREVVRRVHEANVVAQRLGRLGISGQSGEKPGIGSLRGGREAA